MNLPTFVVGTGRCGSTMLSNMLREHPSILSISEFFPFASDIGGRFSQLFTEDGIDGKEFWQILGSITPRNKLITEYDLPFAEFIYPYKSPESRFSKATGVPAILCTTLPHITEKHDRLFDEIKDYVIDLPSAPIREHYKYLFNWLQNRFKKELWIERSGGIFVLIKQIFATFPNARFIHIVRDGRNAALSISKHIGFRIFILGDTLTKYLGVDPYASEDRTNIDKIPLELQKFLPENFARQAFIDHQLPLSLCGQLWSKQIVDGLNVLSKVPRDRVITIVYEDLLKNTQTELYNLTAFLGKEFVDSDWVEKAAATVGKPTSSWKDLPDRDLKELEKACQPGFEALNNAGIVIASDRN